MKATKREYIEALRFSGVPEGTVEMLERTCDAIQELPTSLWDNCISALMWECHQTAMIDNKYVAAGYLHEQFEHIGELQEHCGITIQSKERNN